MPGRRKKAEDGQSAADATVIDEAFKDLIKQAQSADGMGRGRGRGRGQQRYQVTFGNVEDSRESLRAACALASGNQCAANMRACMHAAVMAWLVLHAG